MRRTGRWAAAAVATVIALSTASAALAGEAQDDEWPPEAVTVIDRIAAIVDKEPITLFELLRAAAPFRAKVVNEGGGAKEMNALCTEVLGSLMNDILIRAEARKMRLEVSPEQVNAQIEQVKSSNGWSDEELEIAIRQLGFESLADYRRHAEREILKNQAISIRVSSRIKLDPGEVERVYKEQFGTDKGVEERRAAHILIRVPPVPSPESTAKLAAALKQLRPEAKTDGVGYEELARQLLVALREYAASGQTTFEELARRYSQDRNAQAGGDLGWFTKGDLDPDFEKAAFATEKGEVSEPVKTTFGLHLIKVTGHRFRKEVNAEKEEALKRQIRYRLRERELERLYKAWVDELKQGVFVEVKQKGCGVPLVGAGG